MDFPYNQEDTYYDIYPIKAYGEGFSVSKDDLEKSTNSSLGKQITDSLLGRGMTFNQIDMEFKKNKENSSSSSLGEKLKDIQGRGITFKDIDKKFQYKNEDIDLVDLKKRIELSIHRVGNIHMSDFEHQLINDSLEDSLSFINSLIDWRTN